MDGVADGEEKSCVLVVTKILLGHLSGAGRIELAVGQSGSGVGGDISLSAGSTTDASAVAGGVSVVVEAAAPRVVL